MSWIRPTRKPSMASVWIVEKDATDSYCERTNILTLPRRPVSGRTPAMTTSLSADVETLRHHAGCYFCSASEDLAKSKDIGVRSQHSTNSPLLSR